MFRSRCTIEIGFDADPGDLDPWWIDSGFTWTDVSNYGLSYDVSRGGPEMSGVGVATGFVVLDNLDGRFDPANSGGAYYPDLRVGKPIRIREQINLLSLPVSNGDTVSGLTGTGGSTLSSSSAQHKSGTASILISGGTGFRTAGGTSGIAVFEGEPITAIASVLRTSATGRAVKVQVRFYDAGGTFVSTVSGSNVTSSGSWQQMSVQTTAPATAAYAALYVVITGGTAGDAHYIDELALLPASGAEALVWFPGGPIDVFRGQVDRWLPAQQFPHWSTCTLSVSGALTAMAAQPVGSSLWSTLVARSDPSLWWRLGDPDVVSGAADSSGNHHRGRYRAALGSTPVTITDGLITDDPDGAVNLDATWLQFIEVAAGWEWSATTCTIALWIKAFPGAGACTLVDSSRITIEMDSSGHISADVLGITAATSAFDVRDGNPHLIWLRVGAGTVSLTVDFRDSASASGIFTADRTNKRLYVGRDQAGTVASYASFTIDEFVIWQGVSLAPDWFYLAGLAGAVRSGDQLGRPTPTDIAQFLIDLYGSPTATGGTASPADYVPLRISRIPLAGLLDMLSTASLLGRLCIFEARDGTPTVYPIVYIPSSSTLANLPVPTWGIDPGDFRYLDTPAVDYGEGAVINTVTVSRPAGATPLTFTDATSRSEVGVRSVDLATWSVRDADARQLAGWILTQFASDRRRVYELRPDCSLVDACQMALWHEIGDVCTVTELTVDGRAIDTVVRIVSTRIARTSGANGLATLQATLGLSTVRVQPMVLDSADYGGLDTGGVWGP